MKEIISDRPVIIVPDRLAAELSFLLPTATAAPSGATVTLAFNARGLDNLTVRTDTDWAEAEINGSSVIVTVQPNAGPYREAYITLTGLDFAGFPYTATAMIAQDEASETDITAVVPSRVELPSAAGSAYFDITGDTVDTVTASVTSDWLSLSVEGQRVTYRYGSNTGQYARSAWASVIITKDGQERRYTVTFTQRAEDGESRVTLTAGASSTVGYAEGQVVIPFVCERCTVTDITSDSEWADPDWIASELGNQAFSPVTVAYTENTGALTRKAVISFKGSDDTVYAQYTLIQFGKAATRPDGYVTAGEAVISADTTEGLVQLFPSNISVINDRLETDVDWIHSDDGENGDHQGGAGYTTILVRPDGYFLLFVCYQNTERKARTGHVILTSTDENGNSIETRIRITQEAYVGKVFFPIWKDTDLTLTGSPSDFSEWAITSGGVTLCAARTVFNAEGESRIRLNDILRPFMRQRLDPSIVDVGQDTGGFASGYLAVRDIDGNYVAHTAYACWNDCSYTENDRVILNDPVENVYDPRQLVPLSFISATGEVTALVTRKIQLSQGRVTTNHTAQGQIMTVLLSGYGTRPYEWIRASAGGEEITWTLDEGCHTHVLYYTNMYGGVDSLLVRGKVTKSDRIDTAVMTIDPPARRTAHSKKTLYKEITRSWKLTTRHLDEGQTARFANVAESALAFLHDLNTGDIIPVTVDDTSFAYRTFADGKRLIGEVSVTEARERYRL